MKYKEIAVDSNLKLVQLRLDQAGRLFELTDSDREYLGRFLPWVQYVKSVEDSKSFIKSTIDKRLTGEEYGYGIEYDGAIVGHISLMHMNDGEIPEIGYWIGSSYAGRGITTNATRALTEFGLSELGYKRILVRADKENPGSNKVAEKVGYKFMGEQVRGDSILNKWMYEA